MRPPFRLRRNCGSRGMKLRLYLTFGLPRVSFLCADSNVRFVQTPMSVRSDESLCKIGVCIQETTVAALHTSGTAKPYAATSRVRRCRMRVGASLRGCAAYTIGDCCCDLTSSSPAKNKREHSQAPFTHSKVFEEGTGVTFSGVRTADS